MKRRILFCLCVMAAFASFAFGQVKTVTNADLEKYKQKRIQADEGRKAYYAKIGLTEEEVAKRDAAETKAREELSARLRANRLEQERIDQEMRQREAAAQQQVNVFVPQQQDPYFSGGYFVYGNRLYPSHRGRNRHFGSGVQWRATPMGIVYEPGSLPSSIWGPPQVQRSRPAWRNARTPR